MNEQRYPAQAAATSQSLIDRESHFTGSYRTPHNLRIDGRYEGDIDCQGTVFVGETAMVAARVIAGNVIIAGQFEGEIAVETRFEVLNTGRVSAPPSPWSTTVPSTRASCICSAQASAHRCAGQSARRRPRRRPLPPCRRPRRPAPHRHPRAPSRRPPSRAVHRRHPRPPAAAGRSNRRRGSRRCRPA